MLGQPGFRIIQAPTFIPAYVFSLSGSNSLVGLVRSCQALGMFLTPILGATLIEHRRRVLKMVFATGALMRLQVLCLALSGFFLSKEANLISICVFMGLFGFFTGMQSVTFSFLVSKVIPVERRGRLVGFRNTLAGLTASAVGFIGGSLLEDNALGNGYASVFLVAFVLTASGLMTLVFMREPASPQVREASPLGSRLRSLPALLRADPDYANYVLARFLGVAGRMAVPFYIVYAGTRMELSGGTIGLLTSVFLLTQTGSNLAWGWLADRQGFRNVLAGSLGCWVFATLVLMYAPGLEGFIVGFAGLGAGLGGFQMGCVNLVLEFGSLADRPMRIAVAQSGEQLMSILAPLLGGVVVEGLSFHHLFWIAISMKLAALLVTLLRVREPRRRAANA